MQPFWKAARGAAAVLAVVVGASCADDLPTVTGPEQFPGGALPTTVDLLLSAEEFLVEETVFEGFVDPRDASFLMAAREFGGTLDAHALARFPALPDSIPFGGENDTTFTYGGARVSVVVDPDASAAAGPVTLQLWTLAQSWDPQAVTWTLRGDTLLGDARAPWEVAGGTPGRLLSEVVWNPADTTAAADSLTWQVDSLATLAMAEPDFPGVLVTLATPGARVQLSRLALATEIHPTAQPDTTLTRDIGSGVQTFVFSPAPPTAPGVLRLGGVTADRVRLRLDLARTVPACADPAEPDCPRISLADVTLNHAALMLDPRPVPEGFRPLTGTRLVIRALVEPELERRSPLGSVLAVDTVSATAFARSGEDPVALNVTSAVAGLAGADSTAATVALLSEPEGGQFGYAWFSRTPRLRLVYTLPLEPQLP